jgi:hypothetical protein
VSDALGVNELRHYPGCAWICGTHGEPEQYVCCCEKPRFRKYSNKAFRVCVDCGGQENAEQARPT